MTRLLRVLLVHFVLLAFASSGFTVVTGFRDGHYQWEYFRYFSQTGWGVPYQSAYSLPFVLVYLAAYAIGAAAYSAACRTSSQVIGVSGMLLCIAGFASFALELSHWFVDHNRSWIASAPIALFVLAPAAALQYWRRQKLEGHSSAQEPSGLVN